MLSNNIYDYVNVTQGKITVPSIDDGEDCQLMDVSSRDICFMFKYLHVQNKKRINQWLLNRNFAKFYTTYFWL